MYEYIVGKHNQMSYLKQLRLKKKLSKYYWVNEISNFRHLANMDMVTDENR